MFMRMRETCDPRSSRKTSREIFVFRDFGRLGQGLTQRLSLAGQFLAFERGQMVDDRLGAGPERSFVGPFGKNVIGLCLPGLRPIRCVPPRHPNLPDESALSGASRYAVRLLARAQARFRMRRVQKHSVADRGEQLVQCRELEAPPAKAC